MSLVQASFVHEQPDKAKCVFGEIQSLYPSPPTDASSITSGKGSSSQRSEPTDDCQLTDDQQQCPYTLGFTAIALRHEPPDPFGAEFLDNYSSEKLADLDSMSQTELCMSYPPLSDHIFHDQTIHLKITSIIRAGPKKGAQLVVVNGSHVAKLYDPLYYDPSEHPDVVTMANRAYSYESAAYTHLQNFPEVSDLLPKFYGSWTIKVPAPVDAEEPTSSGTREVRLILMEHLQGICMANLDPQTISEHARSAILAQCIEAEARNLLTGLDHDDYVPRNIILEGTDYQTPNIQVKVIDFNWSKLIVHPNYPSQRFAKKWIAARDKWAPKLDNPVMRYTHLDEFACLGWCSQDWYEVRYWLWDTFGHNERYRPVYWESVEPKDAPMYLNEHGEPDESEF